MTRVTVDDVDPAIRVRVRNRYEALAHYAGRNAAKCPSPFRSPRSASEWVALPAVERYAALRDYLVNDESERRAARTRARRARTTPDVPPSYFVPCAGGCGRMLATSGPRPVRRYCKQLHSSGRRPLCHPSDEANG